MKKALKSIGEVALGIGGVALVIGGVALAIALAAVWLMMPFVLIHGALWLSEKLLPILSVASVWAFLTCLFVLIPLAVFHPTRRFAGMGLYVASYIFGLSTWMTSLLLSYSLWGSTAVVIGLVLGGVGVVPVALLATLFKGLWSPFFGLLLLLFCWFGSRSMAIYVSSEHEKRG